MSPKSENFFIYLPLNRLNLQWDLYLTGIGYADLPPGNPYPPQGHPKLYDFQWKHGRVLPEYQIIYISRGRGIFESTETGTVAIEAGQVILLFPGIWHRYKPDLETGWEEHWISLNGEYLYRLAKRELIAPQKSVLYVEDPSEILNVHKKILRIAKVQPTQNSYLLGVYALEMFALVLEYNKKIVEPANNCDKLIADEHVNNALQMIWNHSYRNISVEDLVEQLSITRRTLERKFQKFLGRSIASEITRCRIERAKQLLESTSLPIEHIAMATGFTGADRLGKIFRKALHMTATQYRKKFKAN